MKRLNDFLKRLFHKNIPVPPVETKIEFGDRDADGFKEVLRDGKPVAKLYVWDKATIDELRAIAGIGQKK